MNIEVALALILDLYAQVAALSRENAELRSALAERPTDRPDPPCPEHGPVQVHAGGPDGPLVCPLCPNTVPA